MGEWAGEVKEDTRAILLDTRCPDESRKSNDAAGHDDAVSLAGVWGAQARGNMLRWSSAGSNIERSRTKNRS